MPPRLSPRGLRGTALSVTIASILACGSMPGEADIDIDVDACAGDADVDDTTEVAFTFEESVHEMVTCGNLTFTLIKALINSAQTFMADPDALPGAFSYGDGVYRAGGTGVAMDVWFRTSGDTPMGEPGERIESDLFRLDSYLAGASSSDNGDGTVTVTFDEAGPLAPLLGRGDNPRSPLVLTGADALSFVSNLGTLKLKGVILVDDDRDPVVVTYEIDNPASYVSDTLTRSRLSMDLVTASAVRDDLDQDLAPTEWDVVYGDTAGTLDGVIEADVVGGPFDFHVVYEYLPSDADPAISITCL